MSIRLTRVGRGRADFSEWGLPKVAEALKGLEGVLREALSEIVEWSLEEEGIEATFPFEWAREGKVPDSAMLLSPDPAGPLTVRFTLPFSADDTGNLDFDFDLRQALADSIATCAEDGSYSEGLAAIAREMRALADEIEASLPKE